MFVREFFLRLSRRTDIRLAAFGVVAMLAIYWGFLEWEAGAASLILRRFGYYFVLVAFSLWMGSLVRLWCRRTPGTGLTAKEALNAALAIGLLSLVAINAEPFRCKVLYDEFVLQATAYNMHYFREASAIVRGYDMLGVFASMDLYVDKRPSFFPFLISLVHDFTGYRPVNAYWLNALLLPVTLSLAYYLGRRLNGMRGGLLAVLLLGSLPLLGQNATGSGMELLNVAMILGLIGLAAAYLRQPDELRLTALVLGTVLLVQTRYESAIYAAIAAVVVVLGWWSQRRVILSWTMVLAPLLLLPIAWQNKIVAQARWMWELKDNQASRFGTEYLAANLRGAGNFFFNTSAQQANSWALAGLGFLSLGYVAWRMLRWCRSPTPVVAEKTTLMLFGSGALVSFVLLMFYYWANLDDPLASRLSLPFHLVLVFATVACAARLDAYAPASRILIMSMAVFALGITTQRAAYHHYSNLGVDEIEWGKRYVASLSPKERLIISNTSTIPWLLEKTPSLLIERARQVGDRLQYQLEHETFGEILVFQSLRPSTIDGHHQLVPEDRLPSEYTLEPVQMKRFGTKLVQVSRLVAVATPPARRDSPRDGEESRSAVQSKK